MSTVDPKELRRLVASPVFEFKTENSVTVSDLKQALSQAADEIVRLRVELQRMKDAEAQRTYDQGISSSLFTDE